MWPQSKSLSGMSSKSQISQSSSSGSVLGSKCYYKLSLPIAELTLKIPKCVANIELSHEYDQKLVQALNKLCRKARACKTVKSTEEFDKIIRSIITIEDLGSKANVKAFIKLLKLKMTKSSCECIYKRDLLLSFQVEDFPFFAEHLKNDPQICEQILFEVIMWIFTNVIDRMIYKLFRTLIIDTRRLVYVPERVYQSFQCKILNNLRSNKFIEALPDKNFDKKYAAKLCFVAKKSLGDYRNHRPIYKSYRKRVLCCPKTNVNIKSLNQLLFSEAERVCPFVKFDHLHKYWKAYVKQVKDIPIYGVKLDISDAFGNVKINDLYSMISDTQDFPQTYTQYIKSINNIVKIDYGGSSPYYKWVHGLPQGERSSSSLYAFYRSNRDNKLLQELYTENAFIFRETDDYLYCNSDPILVKRFLETMMHDNVLNYCKTTLILPQNIDFKNEVHFGGASINLQTKMVTMAFKLQGPLHHQFKIWNIEYPIPDRWMLINKQTSFQANQNYFRKLFQCKQYNSKKIRYYNYFCGMIVVAYRLDCVLQAIDHPTEVTQDKIYEHITTNITKEYVNKLLAIWKFPRTHDERLVLEKVCLKAFILVLQRRHQVYKDTIGNLKHLCNGKVLEKPLIYIFTNMCGKIPKQYSQICMKREEPEKKNIVKSEKKE